MTNVAVCLEPPLPAPPRAALFFFFCVLDRVKCIIITTFSLGDMLFFLHLSPVVNKAALFLSATAAPRFHQHNCVGLHQKGKSYKGEVGYKLKICKFFVQRALLLPCLATSLWKCKLNVTCCLLIKQAISDILMYMNQQVSPDPRKRLDKIYTVVTRS